MCSPPFTRVPARFRPFGRFPKRLIIAFYSVNYVARVQSRAKRRAKAAVCRGKDNIMAYKGRGRARATVGI